MKRENDGISSGVQRLFHWMESAPVNLIIDQQKSQSLPSVACTCICTCVRKFEQCRWFSAKEKQP